MRLAFQLLLVLLAASAVFAVDITTRDGKTYKHAKVTGVDADGVRITHSTGVAKVPFDNLPDAIQKEYNYDPAKVAASRKAAEEANAAAAQAATAQRERERIALRAEQETRKADQRRRQETRPIRPVAVAGQDNELTVTLVVAIIIVAIIVAVALYSKRQRERKAVLVEQARQFTATVEQTKALPSVAANIILKPGEVAFYSAASALYETRALRHYQAAHTGFRVAKGVYIGGTSGRSTSTQEWAKIDTGWLTITNQRLVFDGGKEDRAVPLSKIVSVHCSLTRIEVSVEGRQKVMVFDAANPLIASTIIRLAPFAKVAASI
jgi:hypothetical protein